MRRGAPAAQAAQGAATVPSGSGAGAHYYRAIDILVLCTGNQCRSPMGEVLLRDQLHRRGLAAQVTSAGLVSEGVVASTGSVLAMDRRGLDLGAHRSSLLTAERVAGADLVIGMAREHVREAVVLDPDAFGRTFTLRELVRRAEGVGPRRDEPFASWLRRVGTGRRPGDLLGDDAGDDVADPIGQSRRTYERCAAEIENLVDRLVGLAFPLPRDVPA